MNRIEIYDTTLRDGTQGEGFNLSLEDKLLVAARLDALGVDVIEGGFPISNPKDEAFFREIRRVPLKHAQVSAFGMTRRRGMKASDDPGPRALVAAETPVVTLVGKTSPTQVQNVMNVSLDENVAMIDDTVRFLKSHGRRVVYDAEHFFDAFKLDRDYALRTLAAAEAAGADVLCLCDTNGGTMPEQVEEAVRAARAATSATLGIHPHNDSGLALANALAAIRAGARQAQGTVNGVGERCGNLDLLPLVANLRLKYGFDCLHGEDALTHLTATSRYVYEIANQNFVPGQPYVGASAFAHKGGMHVHAVQKDSRTYEHVDPAAVGNERKILVSELSGASNIVAKSGAKFGIENDKEVLRRVLGRVQDLENQGFQFESAEASFELLLRREIGRHRVFWHLDNYRVQISRVGDAPPTAEATVKLRVGDAVEHRVAESDGPVDALNKALRRALKAHLPAINDVHLSDYKVRVINGREETAAVVRVVIEFKRKRADGSTELFGTIGVNGNILDASWQALADAYEYHLIHVAEGA